MAKPAQRSHSHRFALPLQILNTSTLPNGLPSAQGAATALLRNGPRSNLALDAVDAARTSSTFKQKHCSSKPAQPLQRPSQPFQRPAQPLQRPAQPAQRSKQPRVQHKPHWQPELLLQPPNPVPRPQQKHQQHPQAGLPPLPRLAGLKLQPPPLQTPK